MVEIAINTEFILLGQLLKYIGIVSTGGQIKYFLTENEVKINGNVDNRRGRKLFLGDVIEILGVEYIIVK